MKTTRLWMFLPLALTACRHDPGVYVGADEYVAPVVNEGEYVIRPGDVLNVRVFQQDNMSAKTRVRNDGKISLPFLNDVTAAGFTPVVLGAQLQTRLKATFVVDNKAGANGNIGATAAAATPGDGYHFLFSWAGTLAVNKALYKNLSFDAQKDFVPILLVADVPNILVVNNDVPAHDLAEFARYA